MKNISTGTGLCVLGLCLASYPIIDRVMPRAEAGAPHVAAVVAAAAAQVPPEPTIVWMGCQYNAAGFDRLYRQWSDGRLETRALYFGNTGQNICGYGVYVPCDSTEWIEIPAPPSGNGFACRADLDGNRVIDGADLGMVLANWGPQTPCAPEATYPCLTLNQPLLK
jgi:hypothetical protein